MSRADLSLFPFKKRRDLRSAMAKALAGYVAGLEYSFPATRTPRKLAAVYERWADFERRALSAGGALPAAAVLPDRPVPEADAFVPRLLEETWTGGDPALCDESGRQRFPVGLGTGDGFALFAVSEKVVPMVVVVRAVSDPQRQAIVSVFEDSFHELGVGAPVLYPEPVRWGKVLTLADYYDQPCRFTLGAHQLLGDSGTAKENRWLVQFEVLAEAKQCAVARVAAMDARVQVVVDGEAAPR